VFALPLQTVHSVQYSLTTQAVSIFLQAQFIFAYGSKITYFVFILLYKVRWR